jgi:hypothetical protein
MGVDPFANRLRAAVERVVAWGFRGTKSQTSNQSNQETRGAIAKLKKAPLKKTRTPAFNDWEKMMFPFFESVNVVLFSCLLPAVCPC